nr:hypothetical protein GCM10025732_55630 [Glycomyces mayteni]
MLGGRGEGVGAGDAEEALEVALEAEGHAAREAGEGQDGAEGADPGPALADAGPDGKEAVDPGDGGAHEDGRGGDAVAVALPQERGDRAEEGPRTREAVARYLFM